MTLKELKLNNEHYMRQAFDPLLRKKLVRAARFRRNIYLVLFFVGIICIFIAGFSGWAVLSVLSLFLATLSLVVVTKYDTQVFFLKIIATKENPED